MGVSLQCPYCLAKANPWPAVGTSIRFLNGNDVGQVGLVVEDEWGTCPADRFLVKMDYQKAGSLRMVMPSHDLFLDINAFVVPHWMPSVSIEDNAYLHDALLNSTSASSNLDESLSVGQLARGVVACCWRLRLPLKGVDLWPLFKAHGISTNFEAKFVEYFDFGIELLIATNGRKAVKRKRMPTMSKGRYLTQAQRDLRFALFGHD